MKHGGEQMRGKCLLTVNKDKGWRWLWEEVNMWLLYAFGVDFIYSSPLWGKSSRSPSLWNGTLFAGGWAYLMCRQSELSLWDGCVCEKRTITYPSGTGWWGPSHWPSPVQGVIVSRDSSALQSNCKMAGTWRLLGLLPGAACVWEVTGLFSISSLLSSPWRLTARGTGCTQALTAGGRTDHEAAPSFWQVVSWW